MPIVRKSNQYNSHYIYAEVLIPLHIHLTNVEEGDVIPQEEAVQLVRNRLYDLAGSNDGSELLANADTITFK